jgi:uncharacterized Rmd1/YagE family protein
MKNGEPHIDVAIVFFPAHKNQERKMERHGYSDTEVSKRGYSRKKYKSPRFQSKHPQLEEDRGKPKRRTSVEKKIVEDDPDNDESDDAQFSSDEFGKRPQYDDKIIVTGRMRKKQAARSKGGEFQSRRQKRRLYCCCVSSLIKIQILYDYFAREIYSSKSIWTVTLNGDVLILSKSPDGQKRSSHIKTKDDISHHIRDPINISHPENQVVFVFEFGATVFWGFSKGEEKHLLQLFIQFSDKQFRYVADEFEKGEDDMAFVTSSSIDGVHVTGDVIILPVMDYTYEFLLSLSYAIAQSSVVSVFEHRIEVKVADYKYIPESLSLGKPIELSSDKLGMMIGDIFVIKHDLNLHTDILDTPDTLWAAQDRHITDYDTMYRYLELESRVVLINKRLDMLKEVLEMLQQHQADAHINTLDTIIIWLLALEVIVQVFGGGGMWLGFWGADRLG